MKNEITVKAECSVKDLINILDKKDFSYIDKFFVDDTYYIHKDIDISELTANEILNKCILIRNIRQFKPKDFIDSYNVYKITYKYKNIALNGDIISQKKYDCEIKDLKQGQNLLKALGYKKLLDIKEKNIVYSKDGLNLEIKEIKDGDTLIEIETIENNEKFNTIDKLKQEIIKLDIPIDKSNYFYKKAEIKLKKILGEKND